jgi:mannose-1-phosphate guanylyltransferase
VNVGGQTITWITETAPLGTGGAIVHALATLADDQPFFALNGDILTDLDLTAMLALHRERGALATIAMHHVEDARAFGLIHADPDGRVREFLEKPDQPIPGDINAGTYLLDPRVLAPWTSGERISIERDVFPAVIEADIRCSGSCRMPTGSTWERRRNTCRRISICSKARSTACVSVAADDGRR